MSLTSAGQAAGVHQHPRLPGRHNIIQGAVEYPDGCVLQRADIGWHGIAAGLVATGNGRQRREPPRIAQGIVPGAKPPMLSPVR